MLTNIKPAALVAVLALILVGSVMVASDSDAIGEDLSPTNGEPTNINIAPGYRWTYTPEIPSDLIDYHPTHRCVRSTISSSKPP